MNGLKINKENPDEAYNFNEIAVAIKKLEGLATTLQDNINGIPVVTVPDAFPVGSVFLSAVATDPATLLGYGTWSRIAEGQFLVGLKSTDTDFDTAEETGGAKIHIHKVDPPSTNTGTGGSLYSGVQSGSGVTINGDTHIHLVDIAEFDSGNGSTLPPYFVVYIYKRVS
jgi:hypothetical protein